MKKIIGFVVSMLGGSAIGGFIGYRLAKKRYERLADKEIESVKKAFLEMREREKAIVPDAHSIKGMMKERPKKEERSVDIPEISSEEIKDYHDYSKPYRTEIGDNRVPGTPSSKTKKKSSTPKGPYVISPEEFQESHYESKSLYYYTDKILADEYGKIIENPSMLIGADTLTKFGQYEEDAVFVRDDSLGIDYEVLLDERSYKKASSMMKPKDRLLDEDE